MAKCKECGTQFFFFGSEDTCQQCYEKEGDNKKTQEEQINAELMEKISAIEVVFTITSFAEAVCSKT